MLVPYVPPFGAWIEYPAPCPRCGQMATWRGWQAFNEQSTKVEPQCCHCGEA